MPTTALKKYAKQTDAQTDLKLYIDIGRHTALGQALNDAYDGKGKDSGNHVVDGEKVNVRHSSAGVAGKATVTLFHFFKNNEFHLVALGEHVSSTAYRIDDVLGQETAPFQKKKTVGATG
ncbi:hypothetical protein P3T27_003323 [Kitasatospora sp. MAA19]|uniref:hypothetical protein n=1 Tax=unclassified Kitasatospora TaxID=2633591 RepID=UPI0024734DAA|nr:hypothetical protein [Kitasatospora sp. MAA19]MDH6706596.1 hypothetical protein [Kitasatospora sp. MAA19]